MDLVNFGVFAKCLPQGLFVRCWLEPGTPASANGICLPALWSTTGLHWLCPCDHPPMRRGATDARVCRGRRTRRLATVRPARRVFYRRAAGWGPRRLPSGLAIGESGWQFVMNREPSTADSPSCSGGGRHKEGQKPNAQQPQGPTVRSKAHRPRRPGTNGRGTRPSCRDQASPLCAWSAKGLHLG